MNKSEFEKLWDKQPVLPLYPVSRIKDFCRKVHINALEWADKHPDKIKDEIGKCEAKGNK